MSSLWWADETTFFLHFSYLFMFNVYKPSHPAFYTFLRHDFFQEETGLFHYITFYKGLMKKPQMSLQLCSRDFFHMIFVQYLKYFQEALILCPTLWTNHNPTPFLLGIS